MKEILLLGKGVSNNALDQFMIKYGIEHDFLDLKDVTDYDYHLVIKGPGLYYQEPVIQAFLEKEVKIITDIEFISWFLNRDYIGVTGTNGKTTTTLLINEILNTTYTSVACGNIGFPMAQAALDYKQFQHFVLELSSFELKGIDKFAPKIAVITNITSSHIDYHETLEDYYTSKMNITKNQDKNDYLIYNLDDEVSASLCKNSEAKKLTFSLNKTNADAYVKGSYFYAFGKRVCSIKWLKVQTNSMLYNTLAAILVAKLLHVKNFKIRFALNHFQNAKYRMQEIHKGIYNDAKSTNLFSTMAALAEFDKKNIYLLCGGYDRKEELSIFDSSLEHIKRAYVYGMCKDKLSKYFKTRKVPVLIFDTLKEATLKALNDRIDEIILYSPMFASYDQYKSYVERGREFNKLVDNYYQ